MKMKINEDSLIFIYHTYLHYNIYNSITHHYFIYYLREIIRMMILFFMNDFGVYNVSYLGMFILLDFLFSFPVVINWNFKLIFERHLDTATYN